MSKEPFHRREYERPLASLNMPVHYFGFTNRILQQQLPKNKINLFVPVYAIMKVKSIQKIDVHELAGQINTVLIIQVLVEDLPPPLVHLLTSRI